MKLYNLCEGGRAFGIAFVITLLAILLFTNGAGATIWTVDDSGGANFTRIQDAIDNASTGDTILVYGGTYYENVNVNKQLTLRGIGQPVVDARGSRNAITLAVNGITLEGFTATRGGSYPYDAGILVTSNNNTLSGNNANSNNYNGIYLWSSNNTLSGNTMTGNIYNFNLLYGGSDSEYNNQIDTSNLVDGKPIYYIKNISDTIYDSSNNAGTLYCISCVNVTIKDMNLNKNGNGIFFFNTNYSKIQNVNASNNYHGIILVSSNNNTLIGNNASNNSGGIGLSSSSNNTVSGNNASYNIFGIGLDGSSNNNTLNGNNANSNNGGGILLSWSTNNNTLRGNNASNNNYGISLYSSNNNTLNGNNANSNNYYGFYLVSSSNNILNGNNANLNNYYGVYLASSSNTLINNIMKGNSYNFGLDIGYFDNQIDTTNLVDGKPIYFIKGAIDIVYDSYTNAGTFYCINCVNVTLKNLDLKPNSGGIFFWNTTHSKIQNVNANSNNYYGIYLWFSSNNTLSGNNASNNYGQGISLLDSSNNTVSGNNASNNNHDGIYLSDSNNNTLSGDNANSNNDHGIFLVSSNNNMLNGNNASNNYHGIYLGSSSNNMLSRNNANSNNGDGITLSDSGNNMLTGNNANSNFWEGIILSDSRNNTLTGNNANSSNSQYSSINIGTSQNNIIYYNNFINPFSDEGKSHQVQIDSDSLSNLWNSPQPITYTYNGTEYINKLGNYWSDYSGIDGNGDGIGDNPYGIQNGEADYYPLMQPFETYIQTPTTTKMKLNETASSTHTLFEDIISQNTTLNMSVTGELNGTLNFTNLEIVLINSGSFNGKGFSKGNWSANIEGNPYIGYWQGMVFRKPDERIIHIKGVVSGGLKGIVEGYLIESINGSGIYDKYHANWTISQFGTEIVFAKLDLNGKVNYQNEVEYSSELYALQTSVEGRTSGYYNGSLGIVLTHIRIDNETIPYYGEGFSIVSYVSESGSGEGWTYDRLTSPGIVEMKGFISEPLIGIVSGVLENRSARSLKLDLETIFKGLPPREDLRVWTWGPKRVSPGQGFSYDYEISNIGPKTAYDIYVVEQLSPYVKFVGASSGYNYDPATHSVFWDNIKKLEPFSKVRLSTQVEVATGLTTGMVISDYISVEQQKNLNNTYYPGINWKLSTNLETRKREAFFLDATLRRSYADTGAKDGAAHVWFGYKGIPTISKKNYIDNPEGDGKYKIAFSHSGGTQTLLQKIESGNVTVDFAVFAAPALINQTQINDLVYGPNKKVKKVVIVQSTKDVLYQLKLKVERNHLFERNPFPPPFDNFTAPAVTVLETPCNTFLECIIGWSVLKLGPLPIIDLLNQEAINLNQIPESEEFWVSGSSRTSQMLFQPSENIKVIQLEPDGNTSIQVHEYLRDNTIARFLKGDYPFDGSIEGLERKEDFVGQTFIFESIISAAHDPNIKYGHEGFVLPAQKMNYKVEFENEGEGTAFGVYFTDILDEDLNVSTLEIGPVISIKNGSVIAPPGIYNPETRTIIWSVGKVGPKEGGYANCSVNLRSDAVEGTEVINYGTVYFPSVPEETRTNSIVSLVDTTPPKYLDVYQSESEVTLGEIVGAYAYWKDGVRLNFTWLETNESGTWQNVSFLNQSGNAGWSIFTIKPTREGATCWRIHANDTAGNENSTSTLCFNVLIDNSSPQSINNLTLQAAGNTWLNFTWTNPPDPDFSHVMLYLNGSFLTGIQAPQDSYNITGLTPDTLIELGTHTVDTSGNINQTWVNATARTAPDIITPSITVVSPDGGENWERGTIHTISWDYTGSSGTNVMIELLKNGVLNSVITSSTSADSSGSGSYNWLINSTQTPGADYKVRITNTTNSAYTDTSNNNFTISSQTSVNLIKNPGFENGTANWTFFTNGTGTFSIISSGYEGIKAAKIALNSGGTNIQLYQKVIALESNTRYRLSFAANSTSGHDLSVNLIKHGSPYTNYGLTYTASLGTGWQTFSTEFTTKGFTGTANDGRLMFWMAPFAAAGDRYYIDNVRLEKVEATLPVIIIQPVNQTTDVGKSATFSVVATDTAPLTYQWQKNGVNISGAISATYTTQTTTILDNGSTFRVIVKNSVGSVISNTATLTVITSINLIRNPGFESGIASWLFYTNGLGSFGVISPGFERNNAAKIALNSGGTNIQLYQTRIALEPNTRYRLSFAANSTSGHDLSVNLIKHGSPYTNYGLAYKAGLDKNWQAFSTEFTTKGFTGKVNDGRLMFWMAPFAAVRDTYYIDDVRLEKVSI